MNEKELLLEALRLIKGWTYGFDRARCMGAIDYSVDLSRELEQQSRDLIVDIEKAYYERRTSKRV